MTSKVWESPQAKNERNWRIYWRIAAGARFVDIADEEGISPERARDVFLRGARARRKSREWLERKTLTDAGIPYDVQRVMLVWREDFVCTVFADAEARRAITGTA